MSDFIVDTPNHKEWILPDRRHHMVVTIYGNDQYWRIVDNASFVHKETKESGTLKLDNPKREDLWALVCELADKKYRKPLQGRKGEARYKAGLL